MANSQIISKEQKILFITQDDPFYISEFFEEFFTNFKDRNSLLGVVICPTMGKKSVIALVKQMYGFYGAFNFMKMLLRYLSVKIRSKSLEKVCLRNGIPVYREERINSDKFIEHWRKEGLDIIVSVASPQIFKNKLLDMPKWGCINIHHARLPFYRGMMPNFWQMYHSEKNSAITVHRINPEIDEGEIILQRETKIRNEESLDHLIKRSKREGAHCIIEALGLIKESRVKYLPNPKEEGSYFSFPTSKDVAEFRKRGNRIL